MIGNMTAVVFEEAGKYRITERAIPQVRAPSDVLARVLACSICGSDVHILADPPGIAATPHVILGHEFVGEVVETGEAVTTLAPGDHIICDNNIPCGVCAMCKMGHRNLCMEVRAMGSGVDGVFAQYAVLPEASAVKIPAGIPIDRAIFAEPLNCVMGSMKKLHMIPGQTALVLGGGPIGMYFTTLLRCGGAAKVLVSEVSDFRAAHAMQCGAARVINPRRTALDQAVYAETDGLGADVVIDAVGVLLDDAIRCVRPGGTILTFGMNMSTRQTISEHQITRKGLTILGNYIGADTLLDTARLLESGMVDFSHMITHRLPLTRFAEGIEAMRRGEALEVILYPFESKEEQE